MAVSALIVYGEHIEAPLRPIPRKARGMGTPFRPIPRKARGMGTPFRPIPRKARGMGTPLARRGHLAQEVAGNQQQLSLFVAIYGSFGGLHVARRASFHFDNTQDVPIPADQIEFAAIMWRTVISGDHGVSPAAQVEISVFLAPPASALVRGCVLRRKRFRYQPVQCT